MFTLLVTVVYFLSTTHVSTPCLTSNRDTPDVEITQTHELCNFQGGEIVEIGFRRGKLSIPKIKICKDPFEDRVFWTKHSLAKTLPCRDDDFSDNYDKAAEALSASHLLQLDEDFDFTFLSPLCDFRSEEEKKLAANALNIVPIRKIFGRGNWRSLENFVRDRVNEEVGNGPVKIVTGIFGHSPTQGSNEVLSYPEYFFKIIVTFEGIKMTYVGANNVNTTVDEGICDVIPNCGWSNPKKGQILCCNLDYSLLLRMGLEVKDVDFSKS